MYKTGKIFKQLIPAVLLLTVLARRTNHCILHSVFLCSITQFRIHNISMYSHKVGPSGGAVVEALRYKPEGRGLYSPWCHYVNEKFH
jgi:hypothetical protein